MQDVFTVQASQFSKLLNPVWQVQLVFDPESSYPSKQVTHSEVFVQVLQFSRHAIQFLPVNAGITPVMMSLM